MVPGCSSQSSIGAARFGLIILPYLVDEVNSETLFGPRVVSSPEFSQKRGARLFAGHPKQ
jgi:hypothetical protein